MKKAGSSVPEVAQSFSTFLLASLQPAPSLSSDTRPGSRASSPSLPFSLVIPYPFPLHEGGRQTRPPPETRCLKPGAYLTNCSSSVEPVRAVVEAAPPATTWATSSK